MYVLDWELLRLRCWTRAVSLRADSMSAIQNCFVGSGVEER
jgi:hypothetical protein